MSLQLVQEDNESLTLNINEVVNLKEVVEGAGELAMREIDPNNFESLVSSDPKLWPPILVTKSTKGYILYDGQHRVKAAKFLKQSTIKAICTTFKDINQLIESAFRANIRHGLPSSMEARGDYC